MSLSKKRPFPIISFRLAVLIVLLFLAADIAVITLVKNERQRMVISDLTSPLPFLLAVAALFFAARYTKRTGSRYAGSWYLWTVGLLCSFFGAVTWSVYELILVEPPFPSAADVFLLLGYVFIWIGLGQYTREEEPEEERKLLLLDNIIVVLGAGLCFWVFLFKPFIDKDGFTLTTTLELVYPMIGMISLWTLMIFFRNQSRQSESAPLLIMGFGVVAAITADLIFAYQSLYETYSSGSWADLCYMIGGLSFTLAAIRQINSLSGKSAILKLSKEPTTSHSFSNRWPVYLPYFWLAVAYILLINGFVKNDVELPQFLVIGLIIGLVIFRQMLTFNENDRLYKNVQAELAERKQAQESLRLANLELDARVAQRTKELQIANAQLVHTNQKIEASLNEKEVLLKEIHHRVKNNLQIVSSLLNLQAHTIKDHEAVNALQNSQTRVRSMALIHERLYRSQNLGRVNFSQYIKDLASYLFRAYQDQSGLVQLATCLDEVDLDIDTAVPFGLVLNELITNSLKYAFPGGRCGEISIQLLRQPTNCITLICADNGVGLQPGQDLWMSNTLGMQLIANLTHQLNGDVEVENRNGLKVRIKIPYKDETVLIDPIPESSTLEGIMA